MLQVQADPRKCQVTVSSQAGAKSWGNAAGIHEDVSQETSGLEQTPKGSAKADQRQQGQRRRRRGQSDADSASPSGARGGSADGGASTSSTDSGRWLRMAPGTWKELAGSAQAKNGQSMRFIVFDQDVSSLMAAGVLPD
jgi:hypothetical protein